MKKTGVLPAILIVAVPAAAQLNFNLPDAPNAAVPGNALPTGQSIPPRVIHREDPRYRLRRGNRKSWERIDALSLWRFAPALLDGMPVDRSLKIEINFNLR
jgi:hypothetical protein